VDGLVIGEYNVIELRPPFSPKNYLEAIRVAENAGIEFLIVDSLTHAWTGEGGMLEIHSNVADRTKNSYTAWREVTPLHNQLVDRILQCDMHVMISLRAKTEYTLEDGPNGKKMPVKKGMEPIFRSGLEYEVTTHFELSQNHAACTTKDRSGLFDGEYFIITPATGAKIWGWLTEGVPAMHDAAMTKAGEPQPHADAPTDTQSTHNRPTATAVTNDNPTDITITPEHVDKAIKAYCAGMDKQAKLQVAAEIKAITGGIVNCLDITDANVLALLYQKFSKQEGP